ncbi:MAG: hypothetical protein WA146_00725 [Thiobacillus sp.]
MNTNSKLIRAVFGICCLCALSGCGDANISEAKAAIEEALFDPSSVEYRNVVSYTEGIVCGEVNAKNKMGGYVGFKDFIFRNGNEPDPFYPSGVQMDYVYSDEIEAWCDNKTNKYLSVLEARFASRSKNCAEGDSSACKTVEQLKSRINVTKSLKK